MTTIPDSGLLTFDFGTLTATHTWDHSQTTYPGWTGTWLDSVDITLVGHSDGGSEPAKTMNWWWWNNQQAIKDAGITNADTYKVSSWAMVVDINFLATAPAFQSVVQHGSSQPAADQTGAIANGFGCQTTDISSGDFCLTEDANTNSLTGVCAQWGFQCNQASGCDPSHATTPVNCDDMTQDPPVSTAVASMADFCLALTAFTQPAVGDIGDEVGVAIWNAATKAIPGIRIGRRVDAITNCDQTT